MNYGRIRDLREDHDKTQKMIAAYLGMHVDVYARYERGERSIPVDVLEKLADYYHVSTDYLTGRTDEKAPVSKILQLLQKNVPNYEMLLNEED